MSTTFKQSRDESEIEIDESGLLPHEWVKKQRTDSEVKRMRESEDEQDSEILAEYHRQLRLNVPIEKTMFSTDRVVYSEHIKNMFRSWPPGLRIEDIEGSEFDEIVDDCEDCKVFNYGTSAFTTTPLMYILLGDFFDSYSPKTPSLDFKCYALSLIKISQLDLHIEESRLNDERRRSDVLFGERFKSLESSGNTTPTPSPQPVYIPVPQPQIQQTLDKIEFHDDKKIETFEKEAQKKSIGSSKTYFIGLLGLTEFPKADNIQGNGTFGIGLGVEAQERIFVEGMFQYASYKGTYPTPANIDEYSGIGAIKFQFSKGTIRPIAGALAVYSYRSYMYNYGGYQSIQYQQQSGSQQSNSSVLDAGLLGGAQFSISDDFAIGAEFRYLWNLTSKTDGYYPSFYPNQQPLDSFSHYIFAITGKFNF